MDLLSLPYGEARLGIKWTPNFWGTQALTGHDVFRAYLMKRERVESDACPCELGGESVEHVIRGRPRFNAVRPKITADHTQYMEGTVRACKTLTFKRNSLSALGSPESELQEDKKVLRNSWRKRGERRQNVNHNT